MWQKYRLYFHISLLLCLLATLVFSSYFLPVTKLMAEDSWYDANYLSRRKVTINNTNFAETFTDFPLYLHLDSTNFDFASAQSNGQDFRPISASGTPLSYEIESWDQGLEVADIWIKIPTITANLNSEYFYIYYNNSTASDGSSKTNVWNSNYRGVYHLSDTPLTPTEITLPIEPISIAGDTNNLYIGSQNGAGLRVISRSDYSVTKTLRPSDNVERLFVRGQYLAFTGSSNKGYVYDLNSDTYVATVSGTALLRSAHIDVDNRAYFGETDSGKVYYTDIGTPGQSDITVGTDDIRDVESNGNELIVGSNDYKVRLLDRTSLTTTHTFTDSANSVEVSNMDDDFIWFGSDYQKVWIKNRTNPFTTIAVLHGPTNDITGIDHDSGYWFVSSDDGNVYIYSDSTYQLVNIIQGGNGSGAEQLWLDKTNDQLFFIRGHNSGVLHEKKLYVLSYGDDIPSYTTRLDSTSFASDLVATESATKVSGKIGSAINFGGIRSYLSQKPYYQSGLAGSYPSVATSQAFYYPIGANFTPFLGDGSLNNYFLRYHTGSLWEAGYLGIAGTGESVTSRVNNAGFESSFSGGLASGWTKEYASHTYSDETTTIHGGSHAQKITATAANQHLGVRQNVVLGTGKLFRFSTWVYSSSGDPVIFNVGSHVNTFTPTANTWTQLSGYVIAAADTKFRIYTTATNVAIGESLIIDDVVVDEITNIPSGEGAQIYSTKTGSTNQYAITNPSLDQNNIIHAGVYKSSLQTQNTLTLEAWVYPTTDTGEGYLSGTWSDNLGYLLYRTDQKIYGKIGSTIIDTGASNLPANAWYHVVMTIDGVYEKIYVDGELYVSEANGLTPPSLGNIFTLGITPISLASPYTGKIDEVRVSQTAASEDWIGAQYASMTNNYLTIANQESYPTPSSSPTNASSTTSTPANTSSNNPACETLTPHTPFIYSSKSLTPTTLTLYFASPTFEIDDYSLEYGDSSNQYVWGITPFGDHQSRTLTIGHLEPNHQYFFRIRSNRGCASSDWSLEYSGYTLPLFAPYKSLVTQIEDQKSTEPSTPAVVEMPPEPEGSFETIPPTHPLQFIKDLTNYLSNFFRETVAKLLN